MEVKIPNSEIQALLSGKQYHYPKYATQIINLANQNAQGTRKKVVGQMSDLVRECGANTMEEWEEWYLKGHPYALEVATDKIYAMVTMLKESIQLINRDLVKQWVEELVIVKTFTGLRFQDVLLRKVAFFVDKPYRLSSPAEESRGIDGYIGDIPVSIKPSTYKTKDALNERIDASIIYYTKKKGVIAAEFIPADFGVNSLDF